MLDCFNKGTKLLCFWQQSLRVSHHREDVTATQASGGVTEDLPHCVPSGTDVFSGTFIRDRSHMRLLFALGKLESNET